ncbi:MAG TPA: hypothetical protein VFK32_02930 [Tepidiformaceae bacterium]|nr:hypothetical protein [Tepidiformaceae bacterium]
MPAPTTAGPQVTVYLVPVVAQSLVVFDIERPVDLVGRWLPWTALPFEANPYEVASSLADTWCDVPMDDLRLVDVMSFPDAPGGWELALVFRAALAEPPVSGADRIAVHLAAGSLDAIGPFDPADLERWVRADASTGPPSAARLVF